MGSLLVICKIIADSWIVYLACFYLMIRYQGNHCLAYRKSMRYASSNKAAPPKSPTSCEPMGAIFIETAIPLI